VLARVLTGGLIGGIAGGAAVAAIQAVTTTPLILHAETFEAATTAAHGLDASRLLTSSIAAIAVATGYTLLLLGGMLTAHRAITARSVLPWAMAGFLATGLAPAFGMAPELPGAAAADLGARQLWWIGTAIATAAGLAAIAFGRGFLWTAAGVGLIVLPHLIGAPAALAPVSRVPAEIAARFAAMSLAIQALTWLVPAAIAGFAIAWLDRRAAAVGDGPAAGKKAASSARHGTGS
jgi:cobalt transporter subunit CbtA